jgi:hypothetical protein
MLLLLLLLAGIVLCLITLSLVMRDAESQLK